jgi:L-lactate dehydrogenase complex protein LldG
MSSRDLILARVRAAAPKPRPLPEVPMFDHDLPPAVDAFKNSFARLGGTWCDAPANESIEALIRSRFPHACVICSATPEVAGTLRVESVEQPRDLANVDVAVVRPAFAVAETGSIWLSEKEFGINALGYLPQHLVALLDCADIVGNLHQAYHRSAFFEVHYAVLMSGPSATADIEGVLVRGAQGVRSLMVIPVARPAKIS